jgi:hypothetical protein
MIFFLFKDKTCNQHITPMKNSKKIVIFILKKAENTEGVSSQVNYDFRFWIYDY